MINERFHLFLQVKKLFFRQVRTCKNRFLHPGAKPLQRPDYPVADTVVTDVVADKIKHLIIRLTFNG